MENERIYPIWCLLGKNPYRYVVALVVQGSWFKPFKTNSTHVLGTNYLALEWWDIFLQWCLAAGAMYVPRFGSCTESVY